MIVVDTSALMTILLREPESEACTEALQSGGELLISAGTVAECLIVAGRKGLSAQALALIEGLNFTVAAMFEVDARRAAEAYAQWGKGVHPARLNLGDCFAYALAKARDCPLLYVGDDFARTDVVSVLQSRGA